MVMKFKLVGGILFVLVLLACCVAVDCADDGVICYHNDSQIKVNDTSKVLLVNESSHTIIHKTGDKLYSSYPTITMTGKPSCNRCASKGCAYTWRTRTYLNYCPHCHHWNCLGNKHKYGSRYEQEITCFNCDSDFCINCGKTKYSWSNVYLRKC